MPRWLDEDAFQLGALITTLEALAGDHAAHCSHLHANFEQLAIGPAAQPPPGSQG